MSEGRARKGQKPQELMKNKMQANHVEATEAEPEGTPREVTIDYKAADRGSLHSKSMVH